MQPAQNKNRNRRPKRRRTAPTRSPRNIPVTRKRAMQIVDLADKFPQNPVTSLDSIGKDVEAKMERIEALADALGVCGRLDARRITREYTREMAGLPLQADRERFEGPRGTTPDLRVVAQFPDDRRGDVGPLVQFLHLKAEFVETRVDRSGDRVPVLRHSHPSSVTSDDANHATDLTGATRGDLRENADVGANDDEIALGGEV